MFFRWFVCILIGICGRKSDKMGSVRRTEWNRGVVRVTRVFHCSIAFFLAANVPVNCPAIIPKIYRKTYNVIKIYWHLFVFSLDSSYNCQLLAVFSILLHASFSFPTRSCKRNKPSPQCYRERHLFFIANLSPVHNPGNKTLIFGQQPYISFPG